MEQVNHHLLNDMDLRELRTYFEDNFARRGELGASLSIWKNGEEVVSFHDGFRNRERSAVWDSRTIVPVYSATKGPAAATLLHVLSKHGLDEHCLVTEVWSGFAVVAATFGEMLSHQCGLAALSHPADVYDHRAVIEAVEQSRPEWVPPGGGHGYHPRTYGFLLDECVRRLEGKSLGRVWNEEIAMPMGIDFWIGLPETEWQRVGALVPGRANVSAFEQGFYAAFNTAGSLTRRAFSSPSGLHAIAEMNLPRAWKAALPAMGGLGSASGLARFYQCAIGAIDSPFQPGVRNALGRLHISGEDRVLLRETAFTAGCQKDPLDELGRKKRRVYGSSSDAFGHSGAGGSHAFGDPACGLSFGYVMNQMELAVMPGERCMGLVERVCGN